MILAIDPGNIESAYVLMDEDLKPVKIGKVPNDDMLKIIETENYKSIAIEMVESFGMPVGKEVFETVFWIGRFWEKALLSSPADMKRIYRKKIKMNLCNSTKAKDSNIIQALVDRFAPNTRNKGKGLKASPGWFYGFRADIWQAYAVGVTYHDLYLHKEEKV